MDSCPDETDSKLLAKEKGLQRIYGKIPPGRDLLYHQLERKYFDSGDLALASAHQDSSIGAIQTGGEYPVRENISHPAAPVPSSSNVESNADKHSTKKTTNKTSDATQLCQRMKTDTATMEEG